jgi:predicted 3-demethylubiquinone-9 3-methyltransferase (glyoxalase superfamily)
MGQCGWLKDKYGVSWQIVPTVLTKMLQDTNPKKTEKIMKELLQMEKIEIAKLKRAYAEG